MNMLKRINYMKLRGEKKKDRRKNKFNLNDKNK